MTPFQSNLPSCTHPTSTPPSAGVFHENLSRLQRLTPRLARPPASQVNAPPGEPGALVTRRHFLARARELLADDGDAHLTRKDAMAEMTNVGNGAMIGVRFVWKGHVTRSVFLAGSVCCGGLPVAMWISNEHEHWQCVIWLLPGVYWYKFVVDGKWKLDNEALQVNIDGVGLANRVFVERTEGGG